MKKKKTTYLAVTFSTAYGITFMNVSFEGTKQQCERYAKDLLSCEIMTRSKYEELIACLL